MNDQLQQALASIITKATSAASNGIDFLNQQLPDVIIQFLHWKVAEAVIEIIMSVAFIAIWTFSMKFLLKKAKEERDTSEIHWEVAAAACGVFGGIGCLFGLMEIGVGILGISEILIAPKIYLIEYAAQLLGK